jgi:hypothetical protein
MNFLCNAKIKNRAEKCPETPIIYIYRTISDHYDKKGLPEEQPQIQDSAISYFAGAQSTVTFAVEEAAGVLATLLFKVLFVTVVVFPEGTVVWLTFPLESLTVTLAV